MSERIEIAQRISFLVLSLAIACACGFLVGRGAFPSEPQPRDFRDLTDGIYEKVEPYEGGHFVSRKGGGLVWLNSYDRSASELPQDFEIRGGTVYELHPIKRK